jgi:hypothetical protein
VRYKSSLAALAAFLTLTSCVHQDEQANDGGAPTMRRLTQDQYRHSIADVFGPDIKVAGRFEPDLRSEGLLAVGSAQVSITPAGFEQYNTMARTIAAQVVDKDHRATLIPCTPKDVKAADDACATQFLRQAGRLLWRRGLSDAELRGHVQEANGAAKTLGGFYPGLEFALAGLLVAPEFVFRIENAGKSGNLDAYSKASRLSFLLWNSTPDDLLLDAAARGELDSAKGLAKQVDRLMASKRLEAGVRAFFTDMFAFDHFDDLSKDAVIYPAYSSRVAAEAREQTLRTITDHLIARKGDYRDLFTTRRTFMTRTLGAIYHVPVAAPNGWEAYEFPASDPRAGLLTQFSFAAVHSHPGRSSPTLRGKAVRELLLCQKVPDPPGNVDFKIVQEADNPQYKTARERLTAHRTEAMCAGCHKITDPIGLALEKFDGLAQYRDTENGAPIDTSGDLAGVAFTDAVSLGKVLRNDPAVVSCLVNSVTKYALGRKPAPGEQDWVRGLHKDFAADGYRLDTLLRRIALDQNFYKMSAPLPAQMTASLKESAP